MEAEPEGVVAMESSTVPEGAEPARSIHPSPNARAQGLSIPTPNVDRRGDDARGGSRLLERTAAIRELATLFDLNSRLPAGVVIVEGPPGVGRTALLHTACQLATDAGSRVLRARGSEHETDRPLGIIQQVVAQLNAIGSLSPAVRQLLAGFRSGQPTHAELSPIFEALDDVLVAHAGARTATVAIDDLHWADPESVQWLCYLARRIETRPIRVVVTVWPVQPSLVSTPLDHLLAEASTRRLHLAPLSRNAVGVLTRSPLDPTSNPLHLERGLGEACFDATGGNPALLFALLDTLRLREPSPTDATQGIGVDASTVDRLLATAPPADVTRSVLRRAQLAGPAAIPLLEAIQVLGPGATPAAIAEVSEVPIDELPPLLQSLRVAGLLADRSPLDFRHPLEAASFATAVPQVRQRALHRRAADHLLATGAPARLVAEHLLTLAPAADQRRVDTLRAAATEARDAGEPAQARSFLLRALDEPPAEQAGTAVQLELALVEAQLHDARAVSRLREVTLREPDPSQVVRAIAELVPATRILRHTAHELLRATRQSSDTVTPDLAGRLDLLEALLIRPSDARRLLGRLATADGTQSQQDISGLAAVQLACVVAASPGRATATAITRDITQHLRPQHLGGDDPIAHLVGNQAILVLMRLGEHDLARRTLRAALRLESTQETQHAGLLRIAARVEQERGQLIRASSLRDRHLRAEGRTLPGFHAVFAAWQADLLALEDHFDEGLQVLAEARRRIDPALLDVIEPYVLDETQGWLHLAQGQRADALAAFRRASAMAESRGVDNPAFTTWRSGVTFALARTAENAQALELAYDDVERARSFGATFPLVRTLLALASAVPAAERTSVLREATEVLDCRSPALLDLRLRLALGRALTEAGDRAAARSVLRVAADLAQHLRSEVLMAQARAALLTAGARPRRLAMTGPDALTPAERRVAELAATAHTNAAIAEMLFINVKTVESHLARCYRKLGVPSRTDLATALEPGDTRPEDVT